MAPTKASKKSVKQPKQATSSGVTKKDKKPRESKKAREKRLVLEAALTMLVGKLILTLNNR
jgi:hypothetical protein